MTNQTEDIVHKPVLLREVLETLEVRQGGIYADFTCGFAGHSSRIAEKLGGQGLLIAVDQDIQALTYARERLSRYENVLYVCDNFSNIVNILENLKIEKIDGALIDLGVSSFQLDETSRGFSYNNDAPLDMRMSRENPLDARCVVNNYSRAQLKQIISDYGEERYAGNIASAIERARAQGEIETTHQLVDIIRTAIPRSSKNDGPHPAKRTFQAIRIEVNNEINIIEPFINSAVSRMNPEGRLAAITFHSLEDRAVKQAFVKHTTGCTCPKSFPICVCGKTPNASLINRKPITAGEQELAENPRSRSAKLRGLKILK